MKRSALKRKAPLKARKRPCPQRPLESRALRPRSGRLKAKGKRSERERPALELFRAGVWAQADERVGPGRCERCLEKRRVMDPHHLLPRSRGGSHAISNGTRLCRKCHDTIHFGLASDEARWLVSTKPRRATPSRRA